MENLSTNSIRSRGVPIPVARCDDNGNASMVTESVRLHRIDTGRTRPIAHHTPLQDTFEESYIVQPDHLLLQYQVKSTGIRLRDAAFEISNNFSNRSRTFTLFSARGRLSFSPRKGNLYANASVGITVKIRESTVGTQLDSMAASGFPYKPLSDTILVLIDDKHSKQIQVKIDIQSTDEEGSSLDTNSFSRSANGSHDPRTFHDRSNSALHHSQHPSQTTHQATNQEYNSYQKSPQDEQPECRFCAIEKDYL
ncbi:hypothetical protein CLU79DRAFT_357656 [Phycomyces nitens]|nr:hypothetical protein CLU79DRAFT_357656 [Phycomyces nitens]